ncbi:MAG: hypothetical protein GXX79_06795 [Actinomycetales bacterium]|nr:hypothetical protein [Actinomycetales bacterium]
MAALALSAVWVVAIAVIVTVLVATGGSDDSADSARSTEIKIGECVKSIEEGGIRSVDVVSCDQPHAAEAFAQFDLPQNEYPGEAKVQEAADAGCSDRIPTGIEFAGIKDLSVFYVYPKRAGWAASDRSVVCLIKSDGDPLHKPLAALTGPAA